MNHDLPTSMRHDAALLRNALLRLTAVQNLISVAVIVAAALIWLAAAKGLLAYGRSIDYDGLHAFGEQATALMKRYSPFFWAAIVAALTLIIAYFLVGFAQSMQRAARQRLVNADIIGQLSRQFGPDGLEVLNWAWQDRQHPITVGVLQRALGELRSGRAGKIALAREHAVLLGQPLPVAATTAPHGTTPGKTATPPASQPAPATATASTAPREPAISTRDTPAATQREPHIRL